MKGTPLNLFEKLCTAAAGGRAGSRVISIAVGTANSTFAQERIPLPEGSAVCVNYPMPVDAGLKRKDLRKAL
jgi:hypothetical protein